MLTLLTVKKKELLNDPLYEYCVTIAADRLNLCLGEQFSALAKKNREAPLENRVPATKSFTRRRRRASRSRKESKKVAEQVPAPWATDEGDLIDDAEVNLFDEGFSLYNNDNVLETLFEEGMPSMKWSEEGFGESSGNSRMLNNQGEKDFLLECFPVDPSQVTQIAADTLHKLHSFMLSNQERVPPRLYSITCAPPVLTQTNLSRGCQNGVN